jgi:sugar phosphate isomerase/epimerase
MKNILTASTNCYHKYPLDLNLEHIAAAGFEYVEILALPIWAEDLPLSATDREIARFMNRVAGHGLKISSLGGQADLGSEEGARNARAALHLAVALGLSTIGMGVGPLGPSAFDPTVAEPFYAALPALLKEAKRNGVKLAFENRGPLIQTGAQARDAVERIGKDAVGIVYDTANALHFGGVRPEGEIDLVLPYLAGLHLKDKSGPPDQWNFPELGTGYLDLRRILLRCLEAGFTGPITVELEFQGDPWPPLEEIDGALRRSRAFALDILSGPTVAD